MLGTEADSGFHCPACDSLLRASPQRTFLNTTDQPELRLVSDVEARLGDCLDSARRNDRQARASGLRRIGNRAPARHRTAALEYGRR
jgi:hypothetical protein